MERYLVSWNKMNGIEEDPREYGSETFGGDDLLSLRQ
jgi:hypothetical protein